MPQDFQTILAAHAARYPGMEPQDYAKLAFQSEFGPAHLISDGEDCLAGLRAEWAVLPPDPSPAGPEDIGNGLCRLPLSGLAEADLPLTAALFRLTAARPRGSRAGLEEKLALLESLPVPGMGEFLAEYRRQGCPAVRHSERFRALYRPHYRVVDRFFAGALPALRALSGLIRPGKPGLPGQGPPQVEAPGGQQEHQGGQPLDRKPRRRQDDATSQRQGQAQESGGKVPLAVDPHPGHPLNS